MNEAVIILCTLSVCFSIIALICGLVSIALVAGFTRSTHTVQFKPLQTNGDENISRDPLEEILNDEPIEENPFRRKPKPEPKTDTESEQKEFMEDVTDSNNF